MKTLARVQDAEQTGVFVSAGGTSTARPSETTVALSSFGFRLCWWLVVLYHTVNACFVVICGVAHLLLSTSEVYQNTWMLAIPQTTLLVAGWSYVGVAALHVSALLEIFRESVIQRKLAFNLRSRLQPSEVSCCTISNRVSPSCPRVFEPLWREWGRLFEMDGYFGPQGRYFEFICHAQQFLDVASQTYQAYVISWSLPARSINRLAVGTLIVYCVNTPMIDGLLRRKPALRRMTSLVVDLVLDFVSVVLVPVWVLVPSLRQYDWSAGRFPQQLTYDDRWVASTMAEGRHVLVNSWLDGVTSLLPHLFSLLAITTVKDILRHSSARVVDSSLILLSTVGISDTRRFTRLDTTRRALRKWLLNRRLFFVMNMATIAWAVTVASLHLLAESQATISVSSCELRVVPWISTSFPCTVALFNCYRLGTDGQDDTLARLLNQFDRRSLTKITFSHCPSLQMPPVITEFKNLRMLEVFNSTISRWSLESALTRRATPRLVQLQLIATNVSGTGGLPDGILHDELPQDLNLVIHRSNVSELPTDIDKIWGRDVRWITLWIEYSNMKALPTTFAALSVAKLSFVGNQLTYLPEDLLTRNSRKLTMVRLSENPLVELPSSAGDLPNLKVFVAENTSVASVPEWLTSWSASRSGERTSTPVSLRGSPACPQKGDSVNSEMLCQAVSAPSRQDFRYDLVADQRPL